MTLISKSGTGMVASSITFRPHLGRGIRDLFRLLHAVLHGTEALVYRNHPREAAASDYNLRADCQITLLFPRSTAVPKQLPHQCRHYQCSVTVSAGADVVLYCKHIYFNWMTQIALLALVEGLYKTK